MTRQSINNDGMSLPISGDIGAMKGDDEFALCKKCRMPVSIMERSCLKYTNALGYELFRIRVCTEKCHTCGKRTIYRHCMNTISNGKYVNVEKQVQEELP